MTDYSSSLADIEIDNVP